VLVRCIYLNAVVNNKLFKTKQHIMNADLDMLEVGDADVWEAAGVHVHKETPGDVILTETRLQTDGRVKKERCIKMCYISKVIITDFSVLICCHLKKYVNI